VSAVSGRVLIAPMLAAASPAMASSQCTAMAHHSFGPGVTVQSADGPGGLHAGRNGRARRPIARPLPRRRHINHRHGKGGTYGIGFAIALPAHWQGAFAQGGGGLNGLSARRLARRRRARFRRWPAVLP
jgi:feruloyl esterase